MQPTAGEPNLEEVSSAESEEPTEMKEKERKGEQSKKEKDVEEKPTYELNHIFLKNWPNQRRTR